MPSVSLRTPGTSRQSLTNHPPRLLAHWAVDSHCAGSRQQRDAIRKLNSSWRLLEIVNCVGPLARFGVDVDEWVIRSHRRIIHAESIEGMNPVIHECV